MPFICEKNVYNYHKSENKYNPRVIQSMIDFLW